MSRLQISLLGIPEVKHGEHILAFPERKALALLAYLAAAWGMHERHKLTRLLWPESDMAHGRTALRITLLHLRHLFEDDAALAAESHLLVTRERLGLNLASGIDLDLQVLAEAWKLVNMLSAPGTLCGETNRTLITQLERAAAVYRGGFLQGFTLRNTLDFDNWVGAQQAYWYQRIEKVFDWLSRLQSAEGAVEQAIATVERWRSFDPLNEDISLRLMQLQFAHGNRIAALKTYENYLEILRTELAARPSQRLVALAEMLRSASPPRGTQGWAGKGTAVARPLLDVPFVGRGAEMSRLMTLYEQACSGQPQAVLLEGEAGIGRTRLATAFLELARTQGADVLVGRVLKTSQRLPYQPLLDILRARLEQEVDLRRLLSAPWLAELSRLLPDLRERYADLPPAVGNGGIATLRLCEALARLFQALASQAPLLIFIDGIGRTDAATLDVLQYLARSWAQRGTPALLLLSRRIETREMEPEIAEWLANLRSVLALTRLELGPLSAADTCQIIRELAGGDTTPPSRQEEDARSQPSSRYAQNSASDIERFGGRLFAETHGQPLYLRALLEELLARGVMVPHMSEGGRWAYELHTSLVETTPPHSLLPLEVRELILRRLAPLAPQVRDLLAAGAVLGDDFTFEEICQAARLTPEDGLVALDEALHNLLLRESGQRREGREEVAYHFADDTIREVVYAEAGDARRRVFHHRAYSSGTYGFTLGGDAPERAGASQPCQRMADNE